MTTPLPATQYAVQLLGPSALKLNPTKAVTQPGPHEILIKMEAVGLCFSDLKLLKQFNAHPRKADVSSGLSPEVLKGIQSYVPGDMPVVPGHEVVCRIIAVGNQVKHHKVGERCLVQADYRDLKTPNSNAAFGYNFEGGLQEYCIIDERVAMDTKGQRFLIPVGNEKSASAVALVEPWACVENSYVNQERRGLKAGGKCLIVVDGGRQIDGLAACFQAARPGSVTLLAAEPTIAPALQNLGVKVTPTADLESLPAESFDDIVYFGSSKTVLDTLNDKLAPRGTMNIVLGGTRIGQKVNVGVGRVHYGMTRWVGTTGRDAAASYQVVPQTGEMRPNDQIVVIGAGGPMGQMHVIRAVSVGLPGLSLVGTDFDDARLASVEKKVAALAKTNGVACRFINTGKTKDTGNYSYFALMAPVAQLVADAIAHALPGALINIFAGIPAPTKHELDLDTYLEKKCFMFGTSGSEIEDMKIVLRKVEAGQLDTNASVDAISGMAGAIAGIKAIEDRTLAGKIIVYPMLHDIGLIPLVDLGQRFPTVAAKLADGKWTKAAEEELLRVAVL
ncbi:MAG: alcohol dehydrogenase catalytic domain-containing protein [Phycisphaerae bacterium]